MLIYSSMNPSYGGRQELPANLAALFRPCAMMVPDYAMIAEVMLFAHGFLNARNLARKITHTLKLCSEQLSRQHHYDYGMRTAKTILVRASNLRRSHGHAWTEDRLILRAITDVNLPKFTAHDLPLFRGIISDLFPQEKLKRRIRTFKHFRRALSQACKQLMLSNSESFRQKCFELHETTQVRHGIMVVGNAGSGKTCVLRALRVAASAIKGHDEFSAIQMTCINPKSVQSSELYGCFDDNTHEWQDGIPTSSDAQYANDTSLSKCGYIDGPVDPIWIESMNTALDDNKKLCLTSCEVIKMGERMSMLFEVDDLSSASLRSGRVGIVFLDGVVGVDMLLEMYAGVLEHY